jgi:hypothetical protein
MTTIIIALSGWIIMSLPLAILLGKTIRFRLRD